jgi:ATP-dependent DNA helicase RecG
MVEIYYIKSYAMSLAISRKIRFTNKMRPEPLFSYFSSTSTLNGVGPKTHNILSRAMGPKLLDLVFTPPSSIINRSYTPKISEITNNAVVTLVVTVGSYSKSINKNQPIKVRVFDETGELTLCFFKAKKEYIDKILPAGSKRIISGKAQFYNSEINIVHPDYVLSLSEKNKLPIIETIYPLTNGLTQKIARKSILNALEKVSALPEWIDKSILDQYGWPKFNEALIKIHSPTHPSDIKLTSPPRLRLAYDELLAKQVAIALVRNNNQKKVGIAHNSVGNYIDELVNVVILCRQVRNIVFLKK